MFWSEKPTLIRGAETLGRQASQWPWLTTGEDSKTCEEANEVRSLKCHFCFKAKQNKALQVLSFVQYSKIRTLLNYTREKRFKKKKGFTKQGSSLQEHTAFTLDCKIVCSIQFCSELGENYSLNQPFLLQRGLKPTRKSCETEHTKRKKKQALLFVAAFELLSQSVAPKSW